MSDILYHTPAELCNKIIVGDCRQVLDTLPAESIHCCITSPPYWGLRDYGLGDDQLGLEPTPEQYIDNLVGIFRQVRRVLREDGTAWLNLGDSYAAQSQGKQGTGDPYRITTSNKHMPPQGLAPVVAGLKPKDLVGIPWRTALALQQDGWWLRSCIIWHKPNCMPESVTDRPTTAHEYVFLLSKNARYFYDADAVREEASESSLQRINQPTFTQQAGGPKDYGDTGVNPNRSARKALENFAQNPGRNLRTVWTIPTRPFSEAHFATFPPGLVEPMVKAGTSEKGCCPECGAPWGRVVERMTTGRTSPNGQGSGELGNDYRFGDSRSETIDWQPTCDCGHEPQPCTILDPFFGAGTVGLVADRLGRSYIGIELNPEYAEMAKRRICGDAPLLVNNVEIVNGQ